MDKDRQDNAPPSSSAAAFDVVAIAASAGGLKALSVILDGPPAGFPAAGVVVQHLDPRHRSMMAEILGRRTALRVKQAEDLWGLKAGEVMGESLADLDIGLPVGRLKGPVGGFLAGGGKFQELVLDATNRRGRPIRRRVTCTVRLGSQGDRRGVVLLMEDVEK